MTSQNTSRLSMFKVQQESLNFMRVSMDYKIHAISESERADGRRRSGMEKLDYLSQKLVMAMIMIKREGDPSIKTPLLQLSEEYSSAGIYKEIFGSTEVIVRTLTGA